MPGATETEPVAAEQRETGTEVEPDASTRERVARSILQYGPSTAAQLAFRLDVTPAAVRRHLDALVEQGHVSASEPRAYGRRGRGRPAKAFALTDAGRADFYHAYDRLAIDALQALVDAGGEQAVQQLARRRQTDIRERYATIRNQDDGTALGPTDVLAAALSAEGYAATTKSAVAGEQLCQHHCPVAHVAAEFPQLCEAETETFSQLLGVHVQRLATIAHGDGVCTTHVPDAPDGVREIFRAQLKSGPGDRSRSVPPNEDQQQTTTRDQQPTSRKATAT